MKLRFPRPQVRWSVWFSGEHISISGTGTAFNVSEKGCKVVGGKTVPKGVELMLRLSFLGGEPPIDVDRAVVRWSKGREFGLQFIAMRPEAQEQLSRFVKVLVKRPRR